MWIGNYCKLRKYRVRKEREYANKIVKKVNSNENKNNSRNISI